MCFASVYSLYKNWSLVDLQYCIRVYSTAKYTHIVFYIPFHYGVSQDIEYNSAIKKNAFESVLMRWMKLEPIIQSEVSQKEKHQYIILMHIYGI